MEFAEPPKITAIDLGVSRPNSARILIAQAYWKASHWKLEKGLSSHRTLEPSLAYLTHILAQARQEFVDMVLFPELSLPEECIPYIQTWSGQTGSIVIAGSHYTKTKTGIISRCPIAIGGKIYFTEKLTPAPAEISPIAGEGLTPGVNVNYFKNTSIGNFGVLICSDYLDAESKNKLPLEALDLLCVPAFQNKSEMYHVRMSLDCEESDSGLYIAYANTVCETAGDGRSAFFGLMDNLFLDKFARAGYTDSNPPLKICELAADKTYMVLEINLKSKKPFVKRTVHSKPNVELIQMAGAVDADTERFAQAIGHHDERYTRIKELFVAPSEYESLLDILEKFKFLFITGDPGIGKTYTSVRLLRYYFEKGYEPIWFAGLEKSERLDQRQILENFRPRNQQVVYFEDPFGRTVFERRDSIFRIFGPLVDHLRDIDARVIITSRREIFEQFTQESLSSCQLEAFTAEMNVVKPSYSAGALTKVLHKLAENAKWYQNDYYRGLVIQQIVEGKLSTPLAIRDFTFSTESVEGGEALLERLQRRGAEERELFAEEIEACGIHTKLALCLIFLFGNQSLATLSGWFNQLASFLDSAERQWNGTAPFFEEVRIQSGYRIEHYGVKAFVLRFIHPYYEEAFAATAERDRITHDVICSLVEFVTRKKVRASIAAVTRHSTKYPDLTLNLLAKMVPVLRAQSNLEDISHFGLKLLGLYNKSERISLVDLIKEVSSIDEVIELLNREDQLQVITSALRFIFYYRRYVDERITERISEKIDWTRLNEKWKEETSFSQVVANWEWACKYDRRPMRAFIAQFDTTELAAKFRSLNATERLRFIKVVGGRVVEPLRLLGESTVFVSRRERVQRQIESGDPSSGIFVDDGAAEALRRGYHLLPVGVIGVAGPFDREDAIYILNAQGEPIGAGIAAYSADEIQLIRGKHSGFISEILSHDNGISVIYLKKYVRLNPRDKPDR